MVCNVLSKNKVNISEVVSILGELPPTKGLVPEHLQTIGGCARTRRLAPGDYLWRQGEESALVYLIQTGQLALEIAVPGQGPFRIETVAEGEFLGCSNLLASSRCQFDARALTAVSCLEIDSGLLFQLLEQDPKLGYELFKRIAPMMAHKLESARLRLLDVHGLGRLRAAERNSRISPRDGK